MPYYTRPQVQQGNGQLVGWYTSQQRPWGARSIPLLLNVTAVIQAVLFILCMFGSNWQFVELKSNPLVGFSAEVLQKYGATDTNAIRDHHQWWRVLSSMFLSAGLVQLWAALMLQWTFGSFLGRTMGLSGVASVAFIGGMGSVLVSANFATKTISTGVTGPGMALLGASLMEMGYNRHRYRNQWLTAIVIAYVLGLLLFMGATPFVDNWCHIAGLFLGVLIAWSSVIIRSKERASATAETFATATAVGVAVAVVAIITASAAGIEAPVPAGNKCGWCDAIVCAQSNYWDCEAAKIYPQNCAFNAFRNGTSSITCPKGDQHMILTNQTTQALLESLCSQYCNIQLPIASGTPTNTGGNKSTLFGMSGSWGW